MQCLVGLGILPHVPEILLRPLEIAYLGWSCCCFMVFPGLGWFEGPRVCHRGEGKAPLWVSPLSHPLTP